MGKDDVVYIHNGVLFGHKKNEIMPFAATRMALEIIILSEVSQKQKDEYHMISFICVIYNVTQMNLFTKQKQTHRRRMQTWMPKGKVGGRIYYINH